VVVADTNALLPSLLTRFARSLRKGTPRYRRVELPQPPEEINPETEYIQTIEGDYGWEYQKNRYYWEPDTPDEMPPV